MLNSLIYVSTAAPRVDEREAEAIAAVSARNNAERAIGGLLLYNGRNFLQVLEGPPPAIDTLMKRLTLDPRHEGLIRLIEGVGTTAAFPEWGMRWINWAESLEQRRSEVSAGLPEAMTPEWRSIVLNFASLN